MAQSGLSEDETMVSTKCTTKDGQKEEALPRGFQLMEEVFHMSLIGTNKFSDGTSLKRIGSKFQGMPMILGLALMVTFG